MSRTIGLLSNKLGRCPRCMKTSLNLSAIAWALFTLQHLLPGRPDVAMALGLAAIGLTMLWLAHLVAFAGRRTLARAKRAADLDASGAPASRRHFLTVFARVLVFAALTTALPYRLARSLQLAQDCNCYTESDCNCPTDFPQCVFNPGTGEGICCGANAVGCAGPSVTYCCPPGTNCYGDDQCSGG